jgi:hypothetical protein
MSSKNDPLAVLAPQDALAVQAVVQKYGFLIDDRRWDDFDEVFTEDAVVDFRIGGTGPDPLVGRGEIIRQFRDVFKHPFQHMLVSHLFEEATDDEVIVWSKALLPLREGGIADIVYRDVVVRTSDGWRIKDKSIKSYRDA